MKSVYDWLLPAGIALSCLAWSAALDTLHLVQSGPWCSICMKIHKVVVVVGLLLAVNHSAVNQRNLFAD
jgi:hypothetical protein